MATMVESPGRRGGSGAGRGALLVGLCLAAACGGRGLVPGRDGATDAADAMDAAHDSAADHTTPPPIDGARDTSGGGRDGAPDVGLPDVGLPDVGLPDVAVDRPPPPPVDAAPDTSGGGQDARDSAPDVGLPDAGSPDVVVDRPPPPPVDAAPDTSGGGEDARDAAPDGSPDAVADAPVEARPDAVVTPGCPVDCSHLPHVRAGTPVSCNTATGVCLVPQGACDVGFAHCSNNLNDGCEADLSKATSCGSCFTTCSSFYPVCSVHNGSYNCGPLCSAPYPNTCYYSCVDYQSDPYNCGGCGQQCYLPNAIASCVLGKCTFTGCSDPSFADCTSEPGCETVLGTNVDCAGCGDKACALDNTLLTCTSANSCASAVCAPGFGNCDVTSPDCETSFAGGGTCLPGYLGTTPLATQALNDAAVAIGTDGSYFLAGEFSGTVDFDPSTAQDIRATTTPDADGFITKINADGSYAWTRTFAGRGTMDIHALAAAAGGAVVAVGSYSDSVDLDPGSAADFHQTATPYQQDAFVVKLAADGSFVWGRTFVGTDSSAFSDAGGVAVDAADAVYVAGSYQSTVDFDSGVGTSLHTAYQQSGALVKLTSAGALSWVRSIEDASCQLSLTAVAVATDGAVWGVGSGGAGPGCTLTSPDGTSNSNDALIVSYSGAGVARGSWTLGGGSYQMNAAGVAAGANGSVYVGGTGAAGLVDFDPGPGDAKRWMGWGSDGYILKLGADGAFNWVQTVSGIPIVSLAGTSDGGVLGVGTSSGAFVTKVNADGSASWTFASGTFATIALRVAARGTNFALAGLSNGSGDFNPGAGIDIVYGDIVFMSRFSF